MERSQARRGWAILLGATLLVGLALLSRVPAPREVRSRGSESVDGDLLAEPLSVRDVKSS
jgi:hypothetical protein